MILQYVTKTYTLYKIASKNSTVNDIRYGETHFNRVTNVHNSPFIDQNIQLCEKIYNISNVLNIHCESIKIII